MALWDEPNIDLKRQSVRSPWKGFSKGEKVWTQILRRKIISFFPEKPALSSKNKCNVKDNILPKNQILDMQENLIGGKLIMIQEYFLVFH